MQNKYVSLSFFKRNFERPKLSKIQKFTAQPPAIYTKTLLYDHLGIQMKYVRSPKMSLRSPWSDLQKTLVSVIKSGALVLLRCRRKFEASPEPIA